MLMLSLIFTLWLSYFVTKYLKEVPCRCSKKSSAILKDTKVTESFFRETNHNSFLVILEEAFITCS